MIKFKRMDNEVKISGGNLYSRSGVLKSTNKISITCIPGISEDLFFTVYIHSKGVTFDHGCNYIWKEGESPSPTVININNGTCAELIWELENECVSNTINYSYLSAMGATFGR